MNMARKTAETGRMLDIDRAKGFGISLVVWGHLAGKSAGVMPFWFYVSVTAVYQFHMPFFMYLSGFVFFLTAAPERFRAAPWAYIWKRFDRLMVPFMAFGLLVVVGKYLVGSFGAIDDRVGDIQSGVYDVVVNSADNPSISIWYLLVLFVYSVASPIMLYLGKNKISYLLILGAILWLPSLPEEFYIHRIAVYFIFFVVGGLVAQNRDWVMAWMARWWWASMLLLAAMIWLFSDYPIGLLLCGLFAIPALHGLFLRPFWQGDSVFLTLGRYSMGIYLMNTIFIGVAKIGWQQALPTEGEWALPFLLSVFAVGIVGPMLVRRTLLDLPAARPVSRYLD